MPFAQPQLLSPEQRPWTSGSQASSPVTVSRKKQLCGKQAGVKSRFSYLDSSCPLLPVSSPRRPQRWSIRARKDQPDPPDIPKEERRGNVEWLQSVLRRFGPMTEKPQNTTILDFEKPLVELDNRIREVRRVAEENGVDVSSQIQELESRAKQLRRDTYTRLTPVQRLQVARHPNRPTFLDIILNISDSFVELHGDRAGLDDPAIVCGLASIDGISFMAIGHQKGRNTKENIHRNFGMPQPNGYRKALRFMKHADHFGFPILTFVDTPGAFAGKAAEEQGQGEAIAVNLREMFGFDVPIISVVIGEGGSGGALAIGCANYSFIMENAVYYVASPEACAAILWKSREKVASATEALRITAQELVAFGVMEDIIEEPLGGAHTEPMASFPAIKDAIMDIYQNKYANMDTEAIKLDRYAKFRKIGQYEEYLVRGGKWKEARKARKEAKGAYTKAGTWAPNEEEARMIEAIVDRDEEWDKSLEGREQYLDRPIQPPGLLGSGVLEVAVAMQEVSKRHKQAAQDAVAARRELQKEAGKGIVLPSGKGNGAFAVEPEDAILGAPDHTAAEEQKIAAEEHKTADTR